MSYNFQQRLGHNAERMTELNSELVGYTHEGTPIGDIIASPIFKRSFTLTSEMSAISVDRQYWAINKDQLEIADVPFVPSEGDLLTRADGTIFRIARETDNLPPYQYLTSGRNRYLVYSVQESEPE